MSSLLCGTRHVITNNTRNKWTVKNNEYKLMYLKNIMFVDEDT